MAPFGMGGVTPKLDLNIATRAGDMLGHTSLSGSPFDSSGWTVNFKTTGQASGASMNKTLLPQGNSMLWIVLIGGFLAYKAMK